MNNQNQCIGISDQYLRLVPHFEANIVSEEVGMLGSVHQRASSIESNAEHHAVAIRELLAVHSICVTVRLVQGPIQRI